MHDDRFGRSFFLASALACLALALVAAPPARAGADFVPRFQHFGVEEGLSQSSAVCMAQDSQGFLWVGTYAGLNRYDGYGFKVYTPGKPAGKSLADNNIRALAPDSDGSLWVGTRSGGLSRYVASTDSFVNYTHSPDDPASIPSNEVLAILKGAGSLLLVGTAGGMAEMDTRSGAFRRIPVAGQPVAQEVVSIAEDGAGRVWAASRRSVFTLSPDRQTLVPLDNQELAKSLGKAQINQLYMENPGVLWIVSDIVGLFRLDLATGGVERHLHTTGVFRMLRDRHGTIWAAVTGGIARMKETNAGRQFEIFPNNPYDPDTISQNDVISLMEDSSGILWAGTYSGGLDKLIPGSRWFNTYRHIPGVPESLPGKEVSAVFAGRDGSLWVGLRYAGLARLDSSRRLAQHFVHDPSNPASLAEDQINCVMEDSKGRIWVGTVESGVSVLDRETGTFRHHRHDPARKDTLSQDKIWWIFEDKDAIIWVGTSKKGLNRLDPETGKVTRFENDPNNPGSISHDRVRHIIQARDGALWIGTNAGLNRMDPATGTFTSWQHDPSDPGSLSNNRVTPIVEDPSGILWVGTDDGLNRFDPATGACTRLGERDGLADDGIQGMAMDAAGNLWMSTFKGISRLNPSTGEIRNYSRRDGLVGVEFYMNAFHQARDGELFFGGFSGINAFHPSEVLPNLHAPRTAISSLKVNNRPRSFSRQDGKAALVLSPADHSLSIEFAAMDFANPSRNRYAYKLEGFDTDWIESGQSRQAAYTNLDPGEYTFLMKAANDEGIWGTQPGSLSVTVVPPYWKTAWFKALLAALAAAVVYAVFSMRVAALKARRRELEETVAKQTASLRVEIDERVRAEADLRDSQQSFQAIFQYSPIAVAISSMRDSRILQVNKAFCALSGYSAEDILGRTGAELGIWQDLSERKAMVSEVLERRVVLNRELGMQDRTGRRMHVLCSAAVIEVFKEPCVLWLVSDITARKVLETELVAAREKAEAANRAKSEFLANMSHEIRSPMNAVLGLTELALRKNPPPELRGYLEKVTSASHVLLGVINDLLDLSKIEAGRMELCPATFGLGPVLDRLRDIFESKAGEKGVAFTVTVGEGVPSSLVGDGLRLEQVLINLAGNAVKFTETGKVEVLVSLEREGPEELVLRFEVSDTGIGMTREQAGRIFNPFEQADGSTSRRFGGTGLGLSIVGRLVNLMGGAVSVRSQPGQGSTFSFTAVFGRDADAAYLAGDAHEGADLSGVRALVVDDNALNRELTVELLRMGGVEAKAASGGHEALEMMDAEEFDVVLLDVQMPVMDGYELARAIRNRPSDRHVVLMALTAHAMSGDKERCLSAGMDGYLTKPVLPDVLFATLKRHLGSPRQIIQ